MDSNIYACHRCGAVDVKCWREYQRLDVNLICVDCLASYLSDIGSDYAFDPATVAEDGTRTGKHGQTDQLGGWWIPAVVVSENLPDLWFWGYTSISHGDYQDWAKLPLRREEAA